MGSSNFLSDLSEGKCMYEEIISWRSAKLPERAVVLGRSCKLLWGNFYALNEILGDLGPSFL
jgi:uncharacterized membrane protein